MQCIGYPTKLSDYMAIDGFVQSFLVISVKYRHGYKDARMYIYICTNRDWFYFLKTVHHFEKYLTNTRIVIIIIPY